MSDTTATKLPNTTQLMALLKEGLSVSEKTASIAGAFGERVKSAVENGNLHKGAFAHARAIFRKAMNNEIAALDHMDHLQVYIDTIRDQIREGGHVGNIDDMARMAPVDDDDLDEDGEPVEEVRDIKRDGLAPADALKAFEKTQHLAPPPGAPSDLDDDHHDDADATAALPPPPVNLDGERKRRGRPRKNPLDGAEPAGSYKIN